MSGWNRLFVVVAVCWALAAPFWVMSDTNGPVHDALMTCGQAAYENYGTAVDARVRLDMDKYRAEMDRCSVRYASRFVSIQGLAGAMIGLGDGTLGLVVWGIILIPLALLWLSVWIVGKTARWIVAGFRH
jgi:hypothetical protein